MNKRGRNLVITVWTKKKNERIILNKCQNTDSVFGTIWSSMDTEKVRNDHFSRRIVLRSPTFYTRFPTRKTPRKARFFTEGPGALSRCCCFCIWCDPAKPCPPFLDLTDSHSHVARRIAIEFLCARSSASRDKTAFHSTVD